jgi:hypothetical protein
MLAGLAGAAPEERRAERIVSPLLADVLRRGFAVRLQATGHSMSPFVRSGDVLTIEPLAGRRPSLGDVLAVASRDGLRVHRLVGWEGGRALLRGDVAAEADPPASKEELLGRVACVERRGRRVRLGTGPERVAIALLSRAGVLRAVARLRQRLRP